MENERLEFKDDFIESVLENANRKVLSDTFEIQLMDKIDRASTYEKEISSILKKSMLCFFSGILLIGIYSLILILGKSLSSGVINMLPILSLFLSIVIGIGFRHNYKTLFQSFTV